MLQIVTPESEAAIRAVADLFRAYFAAFDFDADFRHYQEKQNVESELRRLPQGYLAPDGALLLAYWDDLPAGCVALKQLEPDICEMKRLFVLPAYRQYGIGRALAEAIIAQGRALGYRAMRLDTMVFMKQAQRLYEQLGFREIPKYNDSPLPEAVYLELAL